MTQLQDEILKLLKESMLTEDELKEVTFDKITDQMKNINTKSIENIISGPLAKVKSQAEAAVQSLETALNAYNAVETFYNEKMGNSKATQTSSYAPIQKTSVSKATNTNKGTTTNNNTTPVNNNNINTNASNNTAVNNINNVSNGNSSRPSSFNDWANRIGNGIRNLMNNGNNVNTNNTNNNSGYNNYQSAYNVPSVNFTYDDAKPAEKEPEDSNFHFQLGNDSISYPNIPGYAPISQAQNGSQASGQPATQAPEQTQTIQPQATTTQQVAPTIQPTVQAPKQAQVVQPQILSNAQVTPVAQPEVNSQAAPTPQPVAQTTTAAPVTTKRKGRPAKATKKTAAESFDESDLELQTEGIGDMIGNWQANRRDKQTMIDYLNDATTMLTQANTQITQAKQQYGIVYKQLNDLSEKIKNARKLIEKKKSWFGRTFGFWKGNNTNNNA